MDFALTATQQSWHEEAVKFAREHLVDPEIREHDREGSVLARGLEPLRPLRSAGASRARDLRRQGARPSYDRHGHGRAGLRLPRQWAFVHIECLALDGDDADSGVWHRRAKEAMAAAPVRWDGWWGRTPQVSRKPAPTSSA